jgi:hypothetical protein
MKIAYIFLMERDKNVVTIKHCWEVDIGLSESAKKNFKVTKVKTEKINLAP